MVQLFESKSGSNYIGTFLPKQLPSMVERVEQAEKRAEIAVSARDELKEIQVKLEQARHGTDEVHQAEKAKLEHHLTTAQKSLKMSEKLQIELNTRVKAQVSSFKQSPIQIAQSRISGRPFDRA